MPPRRAIEKPPRCEKPHGTLPSRAHRAGREDRERRPARTCSRRGLGAARAPADRGHDPAARRSRRSAARSSGSRAGRSSRAGERRRIPASWPRRAPSSRAATGPRLDRPRHTTRTASASEPLPIIHLRPVIRYPPSIAVAVVWRFARSEPAFGLGHRDRDDARTRRSPARGSGVAALRRRRARGAGSRTPTQRARLSRQPISPERPYSSSITWVNA